MKKSLFVVCTLLLSAWANFTWADRIMEVPQLSQNDPRWSSEVMGQSGYRVGGTVPPGQGCVMTNVCSIINYYGVQTDPKALNSWLSKNNGYTKDGLFIWDAIKRFTFGKVRFLRSIFSKEPNWKLLDQEIEQGRPVMVEVGDPHFVIITGKSGNTYTVNDPWDMPAKQKTLADFGNTFDSMRLFTGPVPKTELPLDPVTPEQLSDNDPIRIHPNGTILKTKDSPKLWVLEAGQKREIVSAIVYFSHHFDRRQTNIHQADLFVLVRPVELAQYPTGEKLYLNDGVLVSPTNDSKIVYVSQGGRLLKVFSAYQFKKLGYKESNVLHLTPEEIAQAVSGYDETYPKQKKPRKHPMGTLLKGDGPDIYVLVPGSMWSIYRWGDKMKIRIANEDTFVSAYGEKGWDRVITVTDDELFRYDSVPHDLGFRQGSLVQYDQDIFFIEAEEKTWRRLRRKFEGDSFAWLGYRVDQIIDATARLSPEEFGKLHPLGQPINRENMVVKTVEDLQNVDLVGSNLIKNHSFRLHLLHWKWEDHYKVAKFGVYLSLFNKAPGFGMTYCMVKVSKPVASFAAQLKQEHIPLEQGRQYSLALFLRADHPKPVYVEMQKNSSPWTNYGLRTRLRVTTEWQEFKLTFVASATDLNSRLGIQCGEDAGWVKIDGVRLVANANSNDAKGGPDPQPSAPAQVAAANPSDVSVDVTVEVPDDETAANPPSAPAPPAAPVSPIIDNQISMNVDLGLGVDTSNQLEIGDQDEQEATGASGSGDDQTDEDANGTAGDTAQVVVLAGPSSQPRSGLSDDAEKHSKIKTVPVASSSSKGGCCLVSRSSRSNSAGSIAYLLMLLLPIFYMIKTRQRLV